MSPSRPRLSSACKKALNLGLIKSLEDFYTIARAILVKSERYFDLYDQVFAQHFRGVSFEALSAVELTEMVKELLREWLKDPAELARELGLSEEELRRLTPEELLQYFLDRLKEQTEAHHGGNRWIGTGGTSPTGHSGYHPGA